eukprot:Hpha_TRINITY_DN15596_c3_g4::TRINITY_DN15596_c3_g4_i2::g.105302::m.105302
MSKTLESLSVEQLLALIPKALLKDYPADGEPRSRAIEQSSVLLFVDISGFSTVATRLQKFTDEGAEELSFHLNSYFERLIAVVREHEGDIIFFSGDAMLVAWMSDSDDDLDHRSQTAVSCGLTLLTECGEHNFDIDAMGQPLRCTMSLHIGGSTGSVNAFTVGGAGTPNLGQWKYVLTGAPIELAGVCANAGTDGEMVVMKGMVSSDMQVTPTKSVVRVSRGQQHEFLLYDRKAAADYRHSLHSPRKTEISLSQEALRLAAAMFSFDTLLYATVRRQTGELRTVSVVFMQVSGLDCVSTPRQVMQKRLGHTVRTVQRCLQKVDGVLNKVMMDDKGLVCLCLFGIPHHTHEDDAARSLSFVHRCRKRMSDEIGALSFGISRAQVFCGLTGSKYRNEYTVLGDGVNIAARLMCKAAELTSPTFAYPGSNRRIMCDEATAFAKGSNQLQLAFVEAGEILLKGQEQPHRIFNVMTEKQKRLEALSEGGDKDWDLSSVASSGSSASSAASVSSRRSMMSDSPGGGRRGSMYQKPKVKLNKGIGNLMTSGTRMGRMSVCPPKGGEASQGDLLQLSPRSSCCSERSHGSGSPGNKAAKKFRAVGQGRSVCALLTKGLESRLGNPRNLAAPDGARRGLSNGPSSPGLVMSAKGELEEDMQELQDLLDVGQSQSEVRSPRRPGSSSSSGMGHDHEDVFLVGRDGEFRLVDLLLKGESEQPVLHFSGGIGTGKSALLTKADFLAEERNVARLIIKGQEQAKGEQYSGLREGSQLFNFEVALQGAMRVNPDLEKYAPLIHHVTIVKNIPKMNSFVESLDDDEKLKHTNQLVIDLLKHTAGSRKIVIICDDAQWLDDFTGSFLELAMSSGMFLLAASRQERAKKNAGARGSIFANLKRQAKRQSMVSLSSVEDLAFIDLQMPLRPGGGLQELLVDKGRCRSVELGPLTEPQSESLLVSLLKCARVSSALAREVYCKADGVPGYTHEIANALLDGEVVVQRMGCAKLALGVQIDESVAGAVGSLEVAVMRAVDDLSAELSRSLTLSAVLGIEFCFGLYSAVFRRDKSSRSTYSASPPGETPERDEERTLNLLVQAGFLVHKKTDNKDFLASSPSLQDNAVLRHAVPLHRDAIYNAALSRDRRRLHGNVADAVLDGAPLPPGSERLQIACKHFRRTQDLKFGWRTVAEAYVDSMSKGRVQEALLSVAELVSFAEKLQRRADEGRRSVVDCPTPFEVATWRLDAAVCLFEAGQIVTALGHVSSLAEVVLPTPEPDPSPLPSVKPEMEERAQTEPQNVKGSISEKEGDTTAKEKDVVKAEEEGRSQKSNKGKQKSAPAKKKGGFCCCLGSATVEDDEPTGKNDKKGKKEKTEDKYKKDEKKKEKKEDKSDGPKDAGKKSGGLDVHTKSPPLKQPSLHPRKASLATGSPLVLRAQSAALEAEAYVRTGNGQGLSSMEARLLSALPSGECAVNEAGLNAVLGKQSAFTPRVDALYTLFDVLALSSIPDAASALGSVAARILEGETPESANLRPALHDVPVSKTPRGVYSTLGMPSRPSVTRECVMARTVYCLFAGDPTGAVRCCEYVIGTDDDRHAMAAAVLLHTALQWYDETAVRAKLKPTADGGLQLDHLALPRLKREATEQDLMSEGAVEGALVVAMDSLNLMKKTGHAGQEVPLAADLCLGLRIHTPLSGTALATVVDAAGRTPVHRALLAAISPSLKTVAQSYPFLLPAYHFALGAGSRDPATACGHYSNSWHAAGTEGVPLSPFALRAVKAVSEEKAASEEILQGALAHARKVVEVAGGCTPQGSEEVSGEKLTQAIVDALEAAVSASKIAL